MSRPGYQQALEWLALNAYPYENDDDYADQGCIHLTSALFDKRPDLVAEDVKRLRRNLRGEE